MVKIRDLTAEQLDKQIQKYSSLSEENNGDSSQKKILEALLLEKKKRQQREKAALVSSPYTPELGEELEPELERPQEAIVRVKKKEIPAGTPRSLYQGGVKRGSPKKKSKKMRSSSLKENSAFFQGGGRIGQKRFTFFLLLYGIFLLITYKVADLLHFADSSLNYGFLLSNPGRLAALFPPIDLGLMILMVMMMIALTHALILNSLKRMRDIRGSENIPLGLLFPVLLLLPPLNLLIFFYLLRTKGDK